MKNTNRNYNVETQNNIKVSIKKNAFGYYAAQMKYYPQFDIWTEQLRLTKYFHTKEQVQEYCKQIKKLEKVTS